MPLIIENKVGKRRKYWKEGFFKSKFGRRIFFLFVLCALESVMRPIRKTILSRFDSLLLVGRDGAIVDSFGKRRNVPPFTKKEIQWMDLGKTQVKWQKNDKDHATVYMAMKGSNGKYLVGFIRKWYLWGGEGFIAPGTSLYVLDSAYNILFSSSNHAGFIESLKTKRAFNPSSGRFVYNKSGTEYLASYWTLFMLPRFRTNWILLQERQKGKVFEAVSEFKKFFMMVTLLAFSFVVFLSMIQIRKSLVPIGKLREATRKVGAGDLSVRADIDSRDELEELGKSFNDMVEKIVTNIEKREKVEKELIKARDEALAAAKAESQFLTNVSHELRTPITSIKSFAEILRDYGDQEPKERKEFLDIIISESERLTRLIEDVLNLSRMQAGHFRLKIREIDIRETIEEVVDAIQPLGLDRGIFVHLDIEPGLPKTAGDRDRLKQVWTNLLSNAIKFSRGEEKVKVRARKANGAIVVEVEDKGPGISPEDQEKIFERFKQVTSDIMTEKPSGTGLGLTIAKDIVERHGGRIEVQSEVGKGSIFRVILPVYTVERLEEIQEERTRKGEIRA